MTDSVSTDTALDKGPLYRPLSAVVVRAPLLPASCFARLGRQFGDGADDWWSDPEIAFAVDVASRDLAQALDAAGGESGASPSARAALQRYLIRAATRPTPFGVFAAVGVARWADRTDLRIAGPPRRPSRTRPDMAWLTRAVADVTDQPTRIGLLRVYSSTCVLERGGRLYLTDPGTGGVKAGPDVSVRATPVTRAVLALARPGIAVDDLRRAVLGRAPGVPPQAVDRLLRDLAEQQFLLPEILPSLVADPAASVAKALSGLGGVPAAEGLAARLADVAQGCRAVDAANDSAAARRALHQVRELDADVQVDTVLPLSGSGLRSAVADEVARAVDVLFRLHPDPGWSPLAGYRAAFHRRYGDGRRVGVLELLDPRFGLGPPSAHRQHDGAHGPDPYGPAARRDRTLRHLAAAALRERAHEVVLDDTLLARLSAQEPLAPERLTQEQLTPDRLPPSVELSVLVCAAHVAALDRGDYLLVVGPNLGAQAAGRGLGRFADMLGPAASDLLVEAAAAEAAVDVRVGADSAQPVAQPVVAELVYRPLRARSANVAVRPLVREYELPVGVAPSAAPGRVLGVDELSVGLVGGRFVLWWDAANRPVRLTSGHMLNPHAAPPLCQALLALSSDGVLDLPAFDWGPAAGSPFLPRVRHGRVVLSPAQWILARDDVDPGCADAAQFAEQLAAWRARWGVPSIVYLAEADNRLLLDLDDVSHRRVLRVALAGARGRPAIELHEALPGPDDGWLPGPRGDHVVELVVPLVRAAPVAAQPRPPTSTWPDAVRLRPPGSDWLYFTLDGPSRTEDGLLTGALGDLADGVVARGEATGWFFVRYADPDRQLRLRLRGDPGVLVQQVLPKLSAWAASAIGTGLRTRMGLQTYERELERYGGPEATAVCEVIACVDSAGVRELLRLTERGQTGDGLTRLHVAVSSVAGLVATLAGPDPAEQARWAASIGGGVTEAGLPFRQDKARLRALVAAGLGPRGPADGAGAVLADVLARRRERLAPLVAQLRRLWDHGTATRSPQDLAGSLVHLHANRLGLDAAAERLALGLLDRTIRSLAAHPVRPDEVSRPMSISR